MFRTDEIIKASKLPPEGVAMSRHIDYIYFIPILFVTIVGTLNGDGTTTGTSRNRS